MRQCSLGHSCQLRNQNSAVILTRLVLQKATSWSLLCMSRLLYRSTPCCTPIARRVICHPEKPGDILQGHRRMTDESSRGCFTRLMIVRPSYCAACKEVPAEAFQICKRRIASDYEYRVNHIYVASSCPCSD